MKTPPLPKMIAWALALVATLFICHVSRRLSEAGENYNCFNTDEYQATFSDLVRFAAYLYIPPSYEACIKKLRQIDGATQQWALEKNKKPEARVTWDDKAPYLGRSPKPGVRPRCPQGGVFIIRTVGEIPKCTVPGHELP